MYVFFKTVCFLLYHIFFISNSDPFWNSDNGYSSASPNMNIGSVCSNSGKKKNYNFIDIFFHFWIFLFRLWGGNRKRFWQLFSSKNGLSFNGGWRFWLHCKGFIQSPHYSSCNGSSRYLEEKKTFEEIFNLEKKKIYVW